MSDRVTRLGGWTPADGIDAGAAPPIAPVTFPSTQGEGSLVTGGMAALQEIESHGVTHVFGLVGSSLMELYDALFQRGTVHYVGARDERAAAFMADGMARASRQVAVVLGGQSGPGVTNLVSGLACAKLGGSPVVAIGGAVSRDHAGRDAFQEVDQVRMLQPVTKAVVEVPTADRIPELVDYACRLAQAEPRGPVFVNMPRDILAEDVESCHHSRRASEGTRFTRSIDEAGVARAAAVLAASARPVVVVGGGVVWADASAQAAELADAIGAPVLTAAGHRDAVNNQCELLVGQMGPRGSVLAQELMAEADCVVGIGTRFGFNSSFFSDTVIPRGAQLVQVDSDSRMVGRYFPADVGIVGDARAFCESLARALPSLPTELGAERRAWRDRVVRAVAKQRGERLAQPADGSSGLGPDELFSTMRSCLPPDPVVTLDAGTWCLLASEAVDFGKSPGLITPLEFATLGFAIPAAIGAQLALPDRRCFALVGDGGASFAVNELATAADVGAPIVVVVMNNGAWGAEKAYQRDFFGRRYLGTDLRRIRFDQVVSEFGARGLRAETVAELRDAMKVATEEDGPALVDCVVDADVMRSFRTDAFGRRSTAGGSAD
ncbi:MAG: thiamine pyrophosphate-binding protein [Acidimicrobiales bacterium]